jgi:hypothetical protein
MNNLQKKWEIIENVIIIYTGGKKEYFRAIYISDDGIFTGRIINNKFVNGGFIPRNNIKSITGNTKKL